MQRMITKQVLFLILLAIALLLLMGMLFYTNARAQDPTIGFWRDFNSNWDWDWDWDGEFYEGNRLLADVRYNRVEGLHVGVRVNQEYWRRRRPNQPFLFGFTGYSFNAKELQYQIGLEKGFFRNHHLAFGGEYHRMIDTPDRWIIPDLENSLAAFFLKEDFHDFFFREGGSGYISHSFWRRLTFSVTYTYDKMDSVEKNTDWALFGGKKKHFRENPPMNAGQIQSLTGRVVFDTRNSQRYTTRGWFVEVEYEHAGNGLGGDFEFDRLVADVRRYQPLGFGQGFDMRIRVGTANGMLPWQRSFHLGGLSTLRGFPYKAYPYGRMSPGGNRLFLAQLEYRMGESNFPDQLGLGFFDLFNFIIFTDLGWVWEVDAETAIFQGFEELAWSNLKSDVGIALANRSGSVRFELARRLDTGHKPFTFTFRINRAF